MWFGFVVFFGGLVCGLFGLGWFGNLLITCVSL